MKVVAKISVLLMVLSGLFVQTASACEIQADWPTDDLPVEERADMAVYIVRMELGRLGLPADTDLENIRQFVRMVEEAESTSRRCAVSTSGAMSFFQFKPDSVVTAVNRFENWTNRQPVELPSWANKLRNDPELIFSVRESLQAMLTMINIVEQTGSDEYLLALINGETDATKNMYYRFHHTDPDKLTVALIERLYTIHFNPVG